jgi:hypothetical protein
MVYILQENRSAVKLAMASVAYRLLRVEKKGGEKKEKES